MKFEHIFQNSFYFFVKAPKQPCIKSAKQHNATNQPRCTNTQFHLICKFTPSSISSTLILPTTKIHPFCLICYIFLTIQFIYFCHTKVSPMSLHPLHKLCSLFTISKKTHDPLPPHHGGTPHKYIFLHKSKCSRKRPMMT